MYTAVATQNLSVGYPTRTVLRDVNFALKPGNMAVLIGANGSGKSTLLRTLAGVQPAIEGDIILDGQAIGTYSRRELARRLSVVFTDRTGGGALTVRECVEIGRHPYTGPFGRLNANDRQIVADAIEAVGMTAKADRYMGTLSDGERQKAMIARALAQQTPFIILDEPTAFLDVAGRLDIIRLLRRLADNGHAVLLSTHDIAPAIATADTLLVVNGETLVADNKDKIIASGALDRAFPKATLYFDAAKGDFVARI